jgi:predicted MFS family arabinose efflux permease
MASETSKVTDQQLPERRTQRWTLTAVCATTFMLLVDITIVNVALPSIQRSLHASLTGLQWVVDAYAVTLAALILTAGALADRYGRRLVFIVGIVVFSTASLLGGIARRDRLRRLARGSCSRSPANATGRAGACFIRLTQEVDWRVRFLVR